MQKKALATTLGAVALIGAIGIGSTFAYLSSTASVKNTFTVGSVGMDLKETLANRYNTETGKYDENGTGAYGADSAADALTETTNSYTELAEGEDIFKNPTVIMADDSMDSWLFVQIQYNADQFETIEVDSNEWAQVSSTVKDGLTVVKYAHKELAEGGAQYEIFGEVTFKGLGGKDAVDDITVSAFAIQQYSYATYEDVVKDSGVTRFN